MLGGGGHGCRPGVDAQLAVDVREVGFHGRLAEEEAGADLSGGIGWTWFPNAGGSPRYHIGWEIPASAGNEIAGQSARIGFVWEARV